MPTKGANIGRGESDQDGEDSIVPVGLHPDDLSSALCLQWVNWARNSGTSSNRTRARTGLHLFKFFLLELRMYIIGQHGPCYWILMDVLVGLLLNLTSSPRKAGLLKFG